jgi:hypothetical protein
MLSVAHKPVHYHVLATDAERWSPIQDLNLNYMGISVIRNRGCQRYCSENEPDDRTSLAEICDRHLLVAW